MVARSQLATLDFNSGTGREQALTKSGIPRFKQSFSRVTQTWVVKKILSKKNKHFLEILMEETFDSKNSGEIYNLPDLYNAPENISNVDKPLKEEAIKQMRTRFLL